MSSEEIVIKEGILKGESLFKEKKDLSKFIQKMLILIMHIIY